MNQKNTGDTRYAEGGTGPIYDSISVDTWLMSAQCADLQRRKNEVRCICCGGPAHETEMH